MPTSFSASKASSGLPGVEAFIAALEHPHKRGVEILREAILDADRRITEEIKWNAPSFKVADHFLTFRLHPPKGIQLIFHVGAKPLQSQRKFSLDLPPSATRWPARDRCVLTISDSKQAVELAPQVALAVQRWLAQLQQ